MDEFAAHLAADAKVLEEDPDTGAKRYRYIRTSVNHFSLAFTYAWLATTDTGGHRGLFEWMRQQVMAGKGR